MLNTSLSGRLRNTQLPKSHGLFPLFEAVVNSIQSTDATYGNSERGRIEIHVIRLGQAALDLKVPGRLPQEPITEFRIWDNGAGFDPANMTSFETLDSEFKLSQGCRGVGRLLWLKAFRTVEVSSTYKDSGRLHSRRFRFSQVSDHEIRDADREETFAEVRLVGFDKKYQQSSRKLTATIARDLLEHCLWYFVRQGGAPDMRVFDGQELVDLHQLYETYMRSSSKTDTIEIRGRRFDVIHLKLKAGAKNAPTLNWCAANRVVLEENISGKVAGLYGALIDEDGEFTYASYLTSSFLDEHVRPERTDFDFSDTPAVVPVNEFEAFQEELFDPDPSKLDIRVAVLENVEKFLSSSLASAIAKSRERIDSFVSAKAPRYRPVLRRLDEKGLGIDPTLTGKELEIELHKHLADLDAEILKEGQQVLSVGIHGLNDHEFTQRLDAYLEKVEEVKKSDLAAYVSRRKLILDLLGQAVEVGPGGKYSREDYIHNLIMPMRTTSEDATYGASNLWIVDERLAFHNYLASDKPLRSMPITGSRSTKEPDLLALQLCDTPILVVEGQAPSWASLSIVEIKRPMRNDAGTGDKDPIEQCLDYLKRVRSGGVLTAKGRPIPNAATIPAFCYIIADLTPSLAARCQMHQFSPTDDGMGFFGYHSYFKAYIEVISFDRLLVVANQRNRAFFDVLGLPAAGRS